MPRQVKQSDDERFMRECFLLGLRGQGKVSPNPLVGAVLVKGGRIVARGYHKRFGEPHAEVECLRNAKGDLRNATLYVNLEPCSHFGKTPPCANLIISRGVGRVVVAMRDPNPLVAGKGLRLLRHAGIRTTVGILEKEARELNRMIGKHITTGLPYVHVKIAQTLDGMIAGGKNRWISSPESRRTVHRWRGEYDAVLVGAGTIQADNPELTARIRGSRNPDVVILDGALSIDPACAACSSTRTRRVFVVTSPHSAQRSDEKMQKLWRRAVEVIALNGTSTTVPLRKVLRALYKRSIGSILVEGGSKVFAQFLSSGLVDELSIFVAPVMFGEGVPALDRHYMNGNPGFAPKRIDVETSGVDALIRARR